MYENSNKHRFAQEKADLGHSNEPDLGHQRKVGPSRVPEYFECLNIPGLCILGRFTPLTTC